MGKIGNIPHNFEDLIGKRFGRLIVIKKAPRLKSNTTRWECKCDCGKIIQTTRSSLISGDSKSCGCYRTELSKERLSAMNTKHNLSKTRIYRIWMGMKARTKGYDKSNNKHYFDRGIKLCNEWDKSFIDFYSWAISKGYNDKLTIDRIDVNGNYEPSNCRWATITQQNRNKTTTAYLTLNDETLSMGEWKEKLGLPFSTMINRKNRGLTDEQVLNIKRERVKGIRKSRKKQLELESD